MRREPSPSEETASGLLETERLGRASSLAMVGRGRELEALLKATAHPPALVLLEGEAGVGKTRLVQELLAREEPAGRQRLLGRCHEISEPFPLGSLLEALRSARLPEQLPPAAGVLRSLVPELAARFPAAPPTGADLAAERHRLYLGLLELLTALSPAVLVLEDLQWADQATVEFLHFLVAHLPAGLSIVCTYRRGDLVDGSPLPSLDSRLLGKVNSTRTVLAPLAREEVRELACTILHTAEVSEEFTDYLCERTAGLPLAIEEVLPLLGQRRDLLSGQGPLVRQCLNELAVPERFRDAIFVRLGRLTRSARSVVEAAAVLALGVDEEELGQLTGLGERECGDALAEALASTLLIVLADGRYGFRHTLVRQAVEEGVPTPLLRRLHLRAARLLEKHSDQPPARIARHYRAAGQTARWVRYAEAAADSAISPADHAAAYVLLRDAISIRTISPIARGSLGVRLAKHALRCREYDDAIGILRSLLRDGTIPRRLRGRLRLWLGALLYDSGEPQAARDEGVKALNDLDDQASAQAMTWLATMPWGFDSNAQRLFWLDRALEIASRSSDRALTIDVATSRTAFLVSKGDATCWRAIRDLPPPAVVPGELEQAIRGNACIADALLHIGHYRRARELTAQSLHLAAHHSQARTAFLELTVLQLDWLEGTWEGLERRLQAQMACLEDSPTALHICQAFMGLLLLAQGRTRPALTLLEPLAQKFDADRRVLTWVVAGVARARLAEHKAGAAVEAVEPTLRIVENADDWLCAGDLVSTSVEALLAARRRADAVNVTNALDSAVQGRDAPAAAAALATCRAFLLENDQRRQEAALDFLEAERAWQALPRPYEAAKARARAGRCLLTMEVDRGHALLLDALKNFQHLGAGWEVESIRHVLRRHGLIPPHRRGRRPYGNELSPREVEVARLAAEGLHNHEIARTLHVSIKTVEAHLSSARRKLGVSPRTSGLPAPRFSADIDFAS